MYKVRLSEHDDKPSILHHNLLVSLISVQKNKPELDQEESSIVKDFMQRNCDTH